MRAAARAVALPCAGVVALGVLLVALGALVPALGPLAAWAPRVVPDVGPALVLAAVVALVVAAVTVRAGAPGRRRAAVAVLGLCAVSTVAIAVVVGAIVAAALGAGGTVDPARAVLALSGASPEPDLRPVYATGTDGQPLHLTVQRPSDTSTAALAPIMVHVHGGGWRGGSDLDRSADMRRYADRGWWGISVEYTLARPGRPTWDAAAAQVACALARIAEQAPAVGGDPSRIVLAGDSAGGQLAVSVAYRVAAGDQRSSCGGRVPTPRAVALQYPAVDPAAGWTPGPDPVVTYTGGTPAEVPDRYRAISALAAITPAAPPTLVLSPQRDSLVSPATHTVFVDAARRAGVDATLVPVPYADHAFDTLGDGTLGQQLAFSVVERWAAERVAR